MTDTIKLQLGDEVWDMYQKLDQSEVGLLNNALTDIETLFERVHARLNSTTGVIALRRAMSAQQYSPTAVQAKTDGEVCGVCNSRNEFASPNQPDGSYICYGCRK